MPQSCVHEPGEARVICLTYHHAPVLKTVLQKGTSSYTILTLVSKPRMIADPITLREREALRHLYLRTRNTRVA